MALAIRKPQTVRNRFLLVLPDKLGEEIIGRAASIAQTFDAELHVFCPVVVPPVPVSGVTPDMPPVFQKDEEFARSQGRRRASIAIGLLAACDIEVHAETRVYPTLTFGVEEAIARIQPNMLLLPKMSQDNVIDRPFVADIEQILSNTDVSSWLFASGRVSTDAVLGLLPLTASNAVDEEVADHVAQTTTQIASAFDYAAHLACCETRRSTIVLADSATTAHCSRDRPAGETLLVNRAHDIAERYGVADTHVHLSEENENDLIERLAEPLGVGLVVTNSRTRSAVGGLYTQKIIPALHDTRCDVLVLNETDTPRQ